MVTGNQSFDTLVCVYQISDRAWIDKNTGVAHVSTTEVDECVEQITLFCEVLKAIAERVLVVTAEAYCFPAFQSKSSEYNTNVYTLRNVLDKNGVAWASGKEILGLPM